MAPLAMFALEKGTVIAFDDHAGWGSVRTESGDERSFHCTQIADGTRTIALGTAVTYRLSPVGLGTWEATDLRTVAG